MTEDLLENLKERNATLLKERETAKRLLDSAVDSLGFSVAVDENFSHRVLFEECARKVRAFITLDSLAFLLFSSDGLDYSLDYCDPPDERPFFEHEMLPLVEDRTFAWAVDRNRPVIVTSSDGGGQILLHSMTTQNRTIGMFMGYLSGNEEDVLDLSFAFLTVVLSSAASLLQNAELYGVIRSLNSELSKKIDSLQKSERSLAEAMRAREIFMANVSHEIRTPLNGILGVAALLEDSALDPRRRDLLNILKDESSSLLRLIDDLLDFSRMEAGKLSFEDAPFSFDDLWSNIRESFSARARQKNIRFLMELRGEPPAVVSGDAFRIRQVFGNIIGNALKFTSKGEVSVWGEITPGEEDDRLLTVDVKDTGIGITEEQAARLFRPFAQGDPSTTRKFGGTGLGLVISRRLLEGMGGVISIENNAGGGAHFRFSLPLKAAPIPLKNLEERVAAPLVFPPEYSILLVEDNETSRLVASSLLKKLGAPEVDVAVNGVQAIEKLSSKIYNLVFMDIQMPEMDGLEAVAIIRDPASPVLDHETPVAAMTANILPADREKYLDGGMNDYIRKPIIPEELTRILSKNLGIESAPLADKDEGGEENENLIFGREALLGRLEGDEELISRTLALFGKDSAKLFNDLSALLEAGKLEEAVMKAHTLRGAAANVEAKELMSAASAVEKKAEEGDQPGAFALMAKVFAARQRFMKAARLDDPDNPPLTRGEWKG